MGEAVLEQRCLIPDPLAVSSFDHACYKHSCLFAQGVSDEEKPVLNQLTPGKSTRVSQVLKVNVAI
jgi:hypothetical protein